MDTFLEAFVAGIIGLAILQAIVPAALQLIDAVLGVILRAPFRWLAHRWRARAQNPYQRGLRRATEGAFIATACVYSASWFSVFLGQTPFGLAQGLTDAPTDYPGAAAFFAALLLGVMWLVVGLRGARGGDRDWMAAFWSAVIAGSSVAALWWHWYPSPEPATLPEIAALKTFYIAAAAAGLVRLWLTMPLPNPAMAAVNRVLRQRNAPMVAARRRRFLFW